MNKARVEQHEHKNQFIIFTDDGIVFQSYDTNIAFIGRHGKVTLGYYWDYSATTRKHLYSFLRKYSKYVSINSKREVEKLIRSGDIIYDRDF